VFTLVTTGGSDFEDHAHGVRKLVIHPKPQSGIRVH
jgi:hypothetical protein